VTISQFAKIDRHAGDPSHERFAQGPWRIACLSYLVHTSASYLVRDVPAGGSSYVNRTLRTCKAVVFQHRAVANTCTCLVELCQVSRLSMSTHDGAIVSHLYLKRHLQSQRCSCYFRLRGSKVPVFCSLPSLRLTQNSIRDDGTVVISQFSRLMYAPTVLLHRKSSGYLR
jgi:hypothetical protein